MTVTALELEASNGGVRVRIDGQPFATVATHDVAELGLAPGRTITDAQAQELSRRADVHAARAVGLRLLSGRALPTREVSRRLLRRGLPRVAVETAVAELAASGLLDDAEFARHYARTRARRRLGAGRLLSDLKRLGVEDRLAQAAVTEALEVEGVDQRELLREAAARKLKSLSGLDRDKRMRRLRAYLLRRGFSSSEVRDVLRDAIPKSA